MKEIYFRINKIDKDIDQTTDLIFNEYKGKVPVKDFQRRLIERFKFDPSDIVDQKDMKTHEKGIEGTLFYYPIQDSTVFKRGYHQRSCRFVEKVNIA